MFKGDEMKEQDINFLTQSLGKTIDNLIDKGKALDVEITNVCAEYDFLRDQLEEYVCDCKSKKGG